MRTIEEGGVMAWPPAVAGEHGCIRPIVFEEGMNITEQYFSPLLNCERSD